MRRSIKQARRRAAYLHRRARPTVTITKSEPAVSDKPLMPKSWFDAVIAPAFREHSKDEVIADMRAAIENCLTEKIVRPVGEVIGRTWVPYPYLLTPNERRLLEIEASAFDESKAD